MYIYGNCSVFVCGLGHGRKAFCAACLFYYDVFTRLPACVPQWPDAVMSPRASNCSLRGTDKQIEPAPFLPALFAYMQNDCFVCVFSPFYCLLALNHFYEYFLAKARRLRASCDCEIHLCDVIVRVEKQHKNWKGKNERSAPR